LLLALASPTTTAAQGIPNETFAASRFTPAVGAGNYLMVDGTVVGRHLKPTAGLLIDYAHEPFVLRTAECETADGDDCELEDTKVDIISYQLTFSAMASLSLWQRLQIGLLVPVIATAGDGYSAAAPDASGEVLDIRGGEAFGLGDPRLSAKVRLTDPGAFGLAVVTFVTAPLGEATAEGRSLGDDGVTAGGHLAVEYGSAKLRFGLNLGGRYRPTREILSTEVGPEATWGIAGAYGATPMLRLIAEVTGASRLSGELDENPIEARLAAELSAGDFAFVLGGGTGIVSGVGIPAFRILGGVGYRPQGLDSDGDGIGDKTDACPTKLEDRDGYGDEDGCPDDDNDTDGIPDGADRCPNDAEDKDGHSDSDGCPDNDDDGDGVVDGYDSCPQQPEDKDGDRDQDGCPDDDRDRDGVSDDADKCPDSAEDTDGFGDEDGCPEADFDGDQIPDDEDQCPDQAEDLDKFEDGDGCPEANPTPAARRGR
jgi:OmpA-OmpF porin, OOP family